MCHVSSVIVSFSVKPAKNLTGVKRIDVVCPGFAVDCLETLEEIAMENAERFRECGGEALTYIPCLNADASHVAALAALVRRRTSDWRDAGSAA